MDDGKFFVVVEIDVDVNVFIDNGNVFLGGFLSINEMVDYIMKEEKIMLLWEE